MIRALLVVAVFSAAVAIGDPSGYRWGGVAGLALVAAIVALKVHRHARERELRRSLAGLRRLHPGDFETEVGRWLRRDGWRIEHRGGTGDGGIDIIARRGRDIVAVQCKRYADAAAVSAAQVRDLYGAAIASGATHALLVTTGRVSRSALAWCEALPDGLRVYCMDGAALPGVASGRERLSHTWERAG